MSAKKPDISQIRKYLNGELDARAMYELERQAHNDPFLMDVLRGMESSGDQQPHLDAIDQMLQRRVQRQSRKPVILMYKYWAAAACLLIVLGAGAWWLTRQKPQNLVAVSAPQVKPVEKTLGPATVIDTPAIVVDKKTAVAKLQTKRTTASDLLVAEPPSAKAPVVNTPKPDTMARIAYNKPATIQKQTGDLNEIVAIPYNAPVGTSETKRIDAGAARTVTGKVVVKNNGEVLPGVPIRINGTDQNIRTNANGMFSAKIPGKSGTLDVNFKGYEPQKIKVDDENNLRIELVPTQPRLAEVAIRDNVTKKTIVTNNNTISTGVLPDSIKDATPITKDMLNGKAFTGGNVAQAIKNLPADIMEKIQIVEGYGVVQVIQSYDENTQVGARPVNGLKNYEDYLTPKTIMPDGATGEVELAFKITANGSISGIHVLSSTNKALNKKAIDLIKNGPKWVRGTDPNKEIRLLLKFHK